MNTANGLTAGWMITLVLLAVGVPYSAAARPPGPSHGPLERAEHVIDQMALDADTEAAVYALLDAARVDRRARHDEIRSAHNELRELMSLVDPERTAVLEQVDATSAAMISERKESLSVLLEVRRLLPVEQRRELIAAMQPPASGGRLPAGGSGRGQRGRTR